MSRIIVLCALPEESQGLIEEYVPTYYTGVGKVNATMTAMRAIIDYNPDLVINFGTAGSKTSDQHTLVDCTKFIQRDMDATGLGFKRYETPFDTKSPKICVADAENPKILHKFIDL